MIIIENFEIIYENPFPNGFLQRTRKKDKKACRKQKINYPGRKVRFG